MKNITLVIPTLKDYKYEQLILSNPNTMNYNAGYEINTLNYHYHTGCFHFNKVQWQDIYAKRQTNSMFFAYIKDTDTDNYIGYVNYQLVDNKYECGIVIEDCYRHLGYAKPALDLLCQHAFNHGVDSLYDSFEKTRTSALKLFTSVGFKIIETTTWKKFKKEVEDGIVCLTKEDYNSKRALK